MSVSWRFCTAWIICSKTVIFNCRFHIISNGQNTIIIFLVGANKIQLWKSSDPVSFGKFLNLTGFFIWDCCCAYAMYCRKYFPELFLANVCSSGISWYQDNFFRTSRIFVYMVFFLFVSLDIRNNENNVLGWECSSKFFRTTFSFLSITSQTFSFPLKLNVQFPKVKLQIGTRQNSTEIQALKTVHFV